MKRKRNILAYAGLLILCFGCVSSGVTENREQVTINNEQLSGSNERVADSNVQAQGDDAGEEGQRVEVFPQLGHNTFIFSVDFSLDGRQIISGSYDGTIKLWDVETGREIRTFTGHTNCVTSVAFSPDRKQIISGSLDNTVKLWDVETGHETHTFSGHTDSVSSVVFSPDGDQIISGSDDKTVKLWEVKTGSEIRTFSGHKSYVSSVTFNPDGSHILSGSWDNTVKLWDVETGHEIRTFSGHTGGVESIAFSHDGRHVISGSNDMTIKLWDAVTGKVIRTFYGDTFVNSVVFSLDGRQILSGYSYAGSRRGTIKLWDVETGREIRTFSRYIDGITPVAFSPDGMRIISGFLDNTVKLWDPETGSVIRSFSGHNFDVYSVALSPDGRHILSGSNDETVKLWDMEMGRETRIFSGHTSLVWSVAFSPDGKQILSGSFDGTAKLWDAETGLEIHTFSGHTDSVLSVAFSPDGKQIISSSGDRSVKLWDAGTGRELRTISEYTTGSAPILFSPDGKKIVTTTNGRFFPIAILDAATGREIITFSGHRGWVEALAFSPDSGQILSGSADETAKLWDVETGKEIRTFSGHKNRVVSVTFSPDGRQVLSGSNDNTIKLWDADTGLEIKTFSGHKSNVHSITFTPNGKRILSASEDGTTRIWDVATGKEIASFISFIDGEWIVITPDGYYNSSSKGDQYLNVRIENNVYGMDQFSKTFYRPDVVERRLQGLPDPEGFRPEVRIQTASIPPDLKVTASEVDRETQQVVLSITATDDIRRISDVQIIINGRLVGGEELTAVSAANLEAKNTRLVASSEKRQYEFTITLQLDTGLNRIEIVAANDYNYGLGSLTIGVPQTDAPPKGDLYILAIGVDRYINNNVNSGYHDLKNPSSDARKLINSFKAQEGKRFDQVHSLCISDNDPVKAEKQAILANMEEFFKRAGPHDTVLLFMSGHGKTEDGVYYFLPRDTVFTGDGKFELESAVNADELTSVLDIPGRKIVMIDSCESGGVDTNKLVRTLKNRSTVVFTASRDGEEAALENLLYGGYFAYSVVEGLDGRAAKEGNEVQIIPLGDYIRERVEELSKDRTGAVRQHPMRYIPDGYRDFVIGVVD